MLKRILNTVALAAFLTPLAFPQAATTPPTPPTAAEMVANQVARLTKLLDLTAAQQAQATTIFTAEHTALDAVKTGMDAAREALKPAVDTNDVGGIDAAALQIGNLTTQQIQGQAKAQAAFTAILTPDQQSKYKELGPGMGGGRGGPGGGRGGPGGGRGGPGGMMGGMGGRGMGPGMGRGGPGGPPKPAQ
jgi:Spy/CpxP family protein refolding chaperone